MFVSFIGIKCNFVPLPNAAARQWIDNGAAANCDMCVCWCVSTGGVPELHQGAAGEWEQAVYLWNQRLHPHLHQPNGMNNNRVSLVASSYLFLLGYFCLTRFT